MPSCVFANFCIWFIFFLSSFLLLQGHRDPASPPCPHKLAPLWTHCGICTPGSLITQTSHHCGCQEWGQGTAPSPQHHSCRGHLPGTVSSARTGWQAVLLPTAPGGQCPPAGSRLGPLCCQGTRGDSLIWDTQPALRPCPTWGSFQM